MTAATSSTHQILTFANAISASRIIAGPLCALLLAVQTQPAVVAALVVMLIAEASDLLDGYVARATSQVSAPGKILDPMADALYRGQVFVAFAVVGWVPLWMLLPIFARDLLVAALREFVLAQGTTQGARLSGKIKAIVQGIVQIGIVVIALIAGVSALTMQVFTLLMWAAVLVTVYSLVDYLIGILRPQA